MDDETSKRFMQIDQRFGAVEADLAVIRSNYVTKADLAEEAGRLRGDIAKVETNIAKLEASMLKWFMATTLSVVVATASTTLAVLRMAG